MSVDSGKMQCAVHDGTYVIRLSGDVRVSLSGAIDDFIRRMLADEQLHGVILDLTAAENIDSTMLGLIARIAVDEQGRLPCRPVIISTTEDINRLLVSMSLDRYFSIVDELTEQSLQIEFEEAPVREQEQLEVCQCVLRAHQTLMQMSDENREIFRDVVSLTEAELKQLTAH